MSNTWKSDLPKVLLLHAYSPRNSGDGLLVELARESVLKAVGPADIRVIASDAEAFGGPAYHQWNAPLLDKWNKVPRRLSMLATGFLGGSRVFREMAQEADLIVAVGGGYLRGDALVPAIKSWGAHFGQLRLAASQGHKSVYLPQSIGPFHGVYKRAMQKNLSKIRTVYARDDRSVSEFAAVSSLQRMPDMAVLELAESPAGAKRPQNLSARPIFVARELSNPRNYYNLLEEVARSEEFEWALQSTGGGNDDYPLTSRLSPAEPRSMKTVLAEPAARIVVSTRLHGALSSLIAGFPAIHLSYERKGWGAYEDLGLDQFVLNARDATLPQINDLLAQIRTHPEDFWATIDAKRQDIRALHGSLISNMRTVASLQSTSGD
ncbi:polysaccharide pyruvyl transferase family protein [Arthrobacter humicola]|uniref:polysaccharide pyruvyl transferase family protein n=1 Tax=Arthrobacter humicola TaxID=409291 RepID=UPI001FACBBF2|nr:polysaccharide pyruvyl transferase family protein [Arthrobacter humicola]MCI9872566.1 polysaccharide pyruvyl transferase family protein [Arthrobacter humicola]